MTTMSDAHKLPGPQPPAPITPIGFGTAAADAEGLTFGDAVRILKARKLTVIVTSLVLYALVIATTFLVYKYAPAYPSEAIFELDPPKTSDLIPEEVRADTRYMDQLLETEARKLKSYTLLLDVAKQPEVKQTRYFQWYDADVTQCADGLQDDLVVAPIPGSRLIRVALATRDPEDSRIIVQTITNRYMATFQSSEREEATTQIESLRDTLAQLNSDLEARRAELARIRENSDIPAMEMQRASSEQYMNELRTNLANLEAQIAAMQSKLNQIQGIDPSQLALTAEQQLLIESDPILRLWQSRVHELDVEIRAMSHRLGPNHRDVEQLKLRRNAYYEMEVARREELISQIRRREVETLRQDLAQARAMQAQLADELADAEAQARDLDRNLQQYMELDEERKRLEKQIEMVETQLTAAQHAARDRSRQRLRVVQAPQKAVRPSRPDPPIWLAAGAVLSLIGGIAFAFLREMTDKAVRTPIDVARYGHLPVLGSVPLLDDEEADIDSIEDAVRKAPQSLVAEAFRKIRTNLEFSGPVESLQSILITSPSPEDGKTTVAVNLAYTIAFGGRRVLLIDCNFRRPALRSLFGIQPDGGLTHVLTRQMTWQDVVHTTDIPNLHVMPSGPLPPTPAELLASTQMEQLLRESAQAYDHVILDGPPVLLISDAIVLAKLAGSTVLVVRAQDNTKGALKRARDQLESINARIVGAVLNGARALPGGYFRQTYREFYEYVGEQTITGLPEPGHEQNKQT